MNYPTKMGKNFQTLNKKKMKIKLFQNFSPASKEAWLEQAKKDLKGADFEQQLVTQSAEGFPIYPYYSSEDTVESQWVKAYDNRLNTPSDIPEASARHWVNAVEVTGVDESSINLEIKQVLDHGAEGIILSPSGTQEWDVVFDGIILPYISVWLKPEGDVRHILEGFSSWLKRQGKDKTAMRGGILWDPLHVGFEKPIEMAQQFELAKRIFHWFADYPHFKSLCLDGTVYHNAGATAVQEIGYGLAALVELWDGLTERGIDAQSLFSDLHILTAVGSDYFMEIAKLKTLRIAVHQLAALYRAAILPEDLPLFAMTSTWSKSEQEPHNNLLRNTTEAMAAIIGGCQAILVNSHNPYSSDAFSKRMARNISTILKEEAYFDKSLDPAAGSYYVESLIHTLYQESFALLKKIETEGGWAKLYLQRQIQREVKAVRNQRLLRLTQERIFPNEAVPNSLFEEEYQLKACSHFSMINPSA